MLNYDLGTGLKQNWLIAEDRFDIDHQGKCEAIFCQGNGYLGQRAALEEDYAGQYRGLLVNGTFNRFDEEEVCELPNLPDLTQMTLILDGEKFSMDRGTLLKYRRVMDLKSGELTRTVTWQSPKGRTWEICFKRFVSLDCEHLTASEVSITSPDGDGSVEMFSGIDGRVTCTGTQHFHEGHKSLKEGCIYQMCSETTQSGVTACLHTAFLFKKDGKACEAKTWPQIGRRTFGVKAKSTVGRGGTLTIEKISTVFTSRDREYLHSENPAQDAARDGLALEKAAL